MHKIIAAAFILTAVAAAQAGAADWNHEATKAPGNAVARTEQTTQQLKPETATATVATPPVKRMQCAVLDGPCGAQRGEPSFFVSPNRRDPDPVFPLGR